MLDIYLDLDGVCAQFVEALAVELDRPAALAAWPAGEYDLAAGFDLPLAHITEICETVDFWREIPAYDWLHELLQICGQAGRVRFASSPQIATAAAYGKLLWINAQGLRREDLILVDDKTVLSRPGAVLIDDCDANVQDFLDADHGGAAIIFPQRWNSLHAIDTRYGRLRHVDDGLRLLAYLEQKCLQPHIYRDREDADAE